MEKKIFFIDFDGTLMRDDKTISDKNREALRNAVDQGHYIALATGRAVSSGRRIAKELELTRPGCYLVAYNGGTIYDFSADCILSNKRLPIEYAEYLLREATEAGIHIQTYSDTQVLAAERNKELDFYVKKTGMPCRITGNLNSMLYEEPPKMLLIDLEHKERLEAFQQAHAEWEKGKCSSFFSCKEYLEYCPLGANKGYGVECSAALHHNKTKTNYHIHLVFSERKMLEQPEVKIATRNMFYDEQGKHRRTKKEILDEQGNIRTGCSIIPKGEVYESHIFTKKEEWFKNKVFTKEVKELFTDTINCYVKEESEKLSVFQQGGIYLATKKIGKNNPKAEEIKADNAARQEWNRTVDVALVEGVPEEDILKIKQEKITDETLQSIRTHGWLPDMFRQIIRGAKDFLQEVIFKFKLPPRPVPKIDLQEWKDIQKLMYELQRQSREIKRTQQDISSLKKQLSELRGLFKGKERKSLEGRIELLEDLEKRLHRSMEQIVKREGYPNVQSFQKVYNKAEELIMEYNEELRAWKNQTEQKQENWLEQPKKASVLEKLHHYQQEGRQQPKRSGKKKSIDRER